MPRTPQDTLRTLKQIKLMLTELAGFASTGGDHKLAWFLDQAANFVASAETRLINKQAISTTALAVHPESMKMLSVPDSKEGPRTGE